MLTIAAALELVGCGGTTTTTVTQSGPVAPATAAGAKGAACGQVASGLASLTPDTVHLAVHPTDSAAWTRASADLDTIRAGIVSLQGTTSDPGQKDQLSQLLGLVDGLKGTTKAGAGGDYVTAGTQLVSGIGRIRQLRSGIATVCTG